MLAYRRYGTNICSSSETTAKTMVNRWSPQPSTSLAAAPIAAMSAPMLIVFAMKSSATRPITSHRGMTAAMFLASPHPVTRPMWALISWIALISG